MLGIYNVKIRIWFNNIHNSKRDGTYNTIAESHEDAEIKVIRELESVYPTLKYDVLDVMKIEFDESLL